VTPTRCAVDAACLPLEMLLAQAPEPAGWLSGPEQAQLASIQSAPRRRQFLAGRWLARLLLSRAAGAPAPALWRLSDSHDGPPRPLGGVARCHVSLAHSGAWVACAVADAPVGIDVEASGRNRDFAGLMQLAGTSAEQALWAGQPPGSQAAFFYRLWTVKEAWIKRAGGGLAPARLARIATGPCPEASADARAWQDAGRTLALAAGPGAAIDWLAAPPPAAGGWSLDEPEPGPGP
jgi:4'-phosphopantetheinyl transferase